MIAATGFGPFERRRQDEHDRSAQSRSPMDREELERRFGDLERRLRYLDERLELIERRHDEPT